MKTMNPSLEIDLKPLAGTAAHKARDLNNARQHGKMQDMFPEVLADVALSNNVAVDAPITLVLPVKSIIRDDEVDTGDRKEDLPAEEGAVQPALPMDMKQYLQVIAAVAQKQPSGGEPALFPAIAAAALSIMVPENKAQGANTKQTEDGVPETVSNDAANPDAAKFPEMKTLDPAKPVERSDKSSRTQPSGLPREVALPVLRDILQPQAPKEVSPAKAAEADLRVIKVETSFSPVASTPFVAQIAKIIVGDLEGPVHSPVAVIDRPLADPRPDVIKSIQIQLHPDDLGKIKVAMHLRGDELRLQIEVASTAVETLLLNDHQALKDLLGQAGYDINDASILIAVSTADPNPSQRSVAASNFSQESLVGQGGRQHPGAHEENQNPFQKARGHHVSASDFENGGEANVQARGSRRVNGVFV
jgi:flagellar hook-length control protein FliK